MSAYGSARLAGQKLSESEREYVRNHPLLGKIPDTRLGAELGVSKFTIARARKRKGIVPFKVASKPQPIGWRSELLKRWKK